MGASADGTAGALVVTTSADGTTSTGTVVINPFSSSKRAVDIRLAADTVSRLRIDQSSGSGSGTLTFGDGTTADTNLYRSAANVLATDDDLSIVTAGKGLRVAEGSNAKMGVATLVGGTVVVSTTAVTANSRIFLTTQSLGTVAVASALAVTARTAATSFTITASAPTDTSVIAWMLVEPA